MLTLQTCKYVKPFELKNYMNVLNVTWTYFEKFKILY